jgi:hypothetical protein
MFFQGPKHLLYMHKEFFPRAAINQDIVEVYDDKVINEGSEDIIHESHECCRGIAEVEWHYKPLK